MEKYEGVVLQNLGPATELDSSMPGEQEGATGFLENLKTVARRVTWLLDIPRNAMQSASET